VGKAARVLLRPHAFAERLSSVSLDELAAQGTTGIIVDLDNTLLGYRQDEPAEADVAWIARAVAAGFKVVLVTNNYGERVSRVAQALGVPAIAGALKPLPNGFVRALRILGTPRRHTVVVGDQLFTDVLGAKLCGLRAILTHPLEPHDFAGTRILRVLERFVLGRRRRKPPSDAGNHSDV
jgi:HAD superfamily phosphatase (TIGR01668 family)